MDFRFNALLDDFFFGIVKVALVTSMTSMVRLCNVGMMLSDRRSKKKFTYDCKMYITVFLMLI